MANRIGKPPYTKCTTRIFFSGYKANLDLKPEKIFTDEIVWEQRVNKNITGVVSLYHYHMKNLIDQSIDADDSLKQYNNISKVTADGIELECNIRSQSGTGSLCQLCLSRGQRFQDKTRLTNFANHLFKAGISQAIRGNLYVGGEFVYESERLTLKNTKTIRSPWSI
jgi:outer membrane cobalamin receptor